MTRKTRRPARRILVAATALIAFVAGVGAHAASAATIRPFKGFYSGSFTPTTTGFSVVGAGRATSLGLSKNQGIVAMQAQVNTSCPTTGFVVTNDEILTAANGDQVDFAILDQPCPVAGEPGIYDGVSTYQITGGTGRFAGASGEGTFEGRGDFTDPSNLTFTYTFDGTISAPNED